MDREKVIKSAEICLEHIDEGDCPQECPYFEQCNKYEKRVIFQPLIRDAIAILKEQEATGHWEGFPNNGVYDYRCSECGCILTLGMPQSKFCPGCGVKMY